MTENGNTGPNRPPCALALSSALEKKSEDKREGIILIDTANEAALQASPSDCANCLGRLGINITCPLPGPQHKQDTKQSLTFSKFTEIEENLGVYQGRFIRILKGKTRSHIPAFDDAIKGILSFCGINQKNYKSKRVQSPNHPSLRNHPTNYESSVDLDNNDQNRDVITKKPPRCTNLLIKFFLQRERTIEGWRAENIHKPPQEKQPIDHTIDESTYQEAVEATVEASIKDDCPSCLAENCPINNRTGAKVVIEPKILYDRTHKKSALEDGTKVRTSEVVVEIARVGRSAIPEPHLNKTDQKLENLGKESLKRSA